MNKTISNEKIIAALLTTDTRKAAADKLGIKKDTLFKRMQEDAFKVKYQAARDDLITEVVCFMRNQTIEAVKVISEIMTDKTLQPQIRINAADCFLRHAERLTESEEIIKRLQELEEQINNYERM